MLLSPGRCLGITPHRRDSLIVGNPRLWWLEWLWSEGEVTPVPASCLLWMSPLYLKKKKSPPVCRGGCDDTDGPLVTFTSRTGSSPSDPRVCG